MSEEPLVLQSLLPDNPPIGVSPFGPTFQPLRINAPKHIWEQRVDGNGKYHFSVGAYPYVGVLDGKVIASTNPEHDTAWTYPPLSTGFRIELADKRGYGWKVENNEIVIAQYKGQSEDDESEFFTFNRVYS